MKPMNKISLLLTSYDFITILIQKYSSSKTSLAKHFLQNPTVYCYTLDLNDIIFIPFKFCLLFCKIFKYLLYILWQESSGKSVRE